MIDGNGISVRSTGIVRKNIIMDVGSGDPIRYFNDHAAGSSNTVLIENNICYDPTSRAGQQGMVTLAFSAGNDSFMAENFIVRFNTLVVLENGPYAITLHEQFDSKNVAVYGNLLVGHKERYIGGEANSESKNYMTRSLEGFRDPSQYDFHLNGEHPANGYATGLTQYPQDDFDGDVRAIADMDAGADQYCMTR